jgi:hypothetical protein
VLRSNQLSYHANSLNPLLFLAAANIHLFIFLFQTLLNINFD